METIIAQDIFRVYGTGRGIHGVAFSISSGESVGILGPNGSGKTTLTRLVAGLDKLDCGRLSVFGKPAYPRPEQVRHRCGIALETPAHWEALSGRQNLWFFGRQYGLSDSDLNERVNSLLLEAGLDAQADDSVASYSFGMRRKLGIIEALISDPDLLILDEPSAGADFAFLERLILWIRRRYERGKTTWLADNDADWLARATTHVILLADGKIQSRGEVRELTASIVPRQRIELTIEQSCSEVGSGPPGITGIHSFNYEGNHIVAEVSGNGEVPIELLRWITSCGASVRSMDIRSVTLYEALMQQTTEREAKS